MSTHNEQLYIDLTDCLDNLVKVYRALLDVVRREKEILTSAKLEDLNENNKSKDAMLVRIRSLENGGSVPILMYTANGDGETRKKATEVGANTVLFKPLLPREILSRIEKLLN